MAANFMNRISMQPMSVSWSEGSSLFFAGGVYGVESGLSTVHFALGKWTVLFPCKPFFI